MSMTREKSLSRDRGVTLILAALLMTVLFVIAALVLDYGFVRLNRQDDKSAADMAAAAGVRSLDNGSGSPQPWKAICTAQEFLAANLPMTATLESITWSNGATPATNYSSNPCTSPSSAPYTTLCTTTESTWGKLVGTADNGRLRVTIESGYALDQSGFIEDGNTAYASDNSASPCLQVAVLVQKRENAVLGGVAGASEYTTLMRSVGRAVAGDVGDIAAALILLERTECSVLSSAGTGAAVRIEGADDVPGYIHADSDASGPSCSASNKVFEVDGSPGQPAIVSADGEGVDEDGNAVTLPGIITSVSLNGGSTAKPLFTSNSPTETCAEQTDGDCEASSPVTGAGPSGRSRATRSVADVRYRLPAGAAQAEANQVFALTSTTADDPGNDYTVVGCSGPFTAPRLWVECSSLSAADFADTVDHVVINGVVKTSGVVRFRAPSKIFIRGTTSGNRRAIELGSPSDRFIVNDRGLFTNPSDPEEICQDRNNDPERLPGLGTTQVVLRDGRFYASGGRIHMCETTVVMLDNNPTPPSPVPCPIPSVNGSEPRDNTCNGNLAVSGYVDWSAPNTTSLDPSLNADGGKAYYDKFEDLALWTETSNDVGVNGSGGLQLSGIYFTPNAKPFTIAGGGSIDIEDAQFLTRRLRVNGGGTLLMKPAGPNSIKLPALSGFTLVR